MKISIRFEKNGQFTEVPLAAKELSALYDIGFGIMLSDLDNKTNHFSRSKQRHKKPFYSLHSKIVNAVCNIIYDGKAYEMKKNSKDKIIMVKCKTKHYMGKKPNWKPIKK